MSYKSITCIDLRGKLLYNGYIIECQEDWRIKAMRKIAAYVCLGAIAFTMAACNPEHSIDHSDVSTEISKNISSTTSMPHTNVTSSVNTPSSSTPKEDRLVFTLTAGNAGEYGKTKVYNAGTEFEKKVYAYYIPTGTYFVTNKGKYRGQVNIYSDETHLTSEGWEEPSSGVAKLVDVGQMIVITVRDGQHIEISQPDVFKFEKKE